MNKLFYKNFELTGSEKEKWERHIILVELFEKGVEIEEIAKIAGLTEKEMDELFPRLY
jgi:lambda repressor-like predicted transcriptional regulator